MYSIFSEKLIHEYGYFGEICIQIIYTGIIPPVSNWGPQLKSYFWEILNNLVQLQSEKAKKFEMLA